MVFPTLRFRPAAAILARRIAFIEMSTPQPDASEEAKLQVMDVVPGEVSEGDMDDTHRLCAAILEFIQKFLRIERSRRASVPTPAPGPGAGRRDRAHRSAPLRRAPGVRGDLD